MKKGMYIILLMSFLLLATGCSGLKIYSGQSEAAPNGYKQYNASIFYSEFNEYKLYRPAFPALMSKKEFNQLFLNVITDEKNRIKNLRIEAAVIDTKFRKFDKIKLKNDKNDTMEFIVDEDSIKFIKKQNFLQGNALLLPEQIKSLDNFIKASKKIKGYIVDNGIEYEIPTTSSLYEEFNLMFNFFLLEI